MPLPPLEDLEVPIYPPLGVLDYPGAQLAMEALTDFVRDSTKPKPPERAYRLNACQKEPWTVAFIEAIPKGAVLWDIGANVGSYTLVAAHRGVLVVAVEPARPNASALSRNVMRNDLSDQVIVVHAALGDSTGLIWLNYTDLRSGAAGHELGNLRNPNHFQREVVPLWRLDDLIKVQGLPAPTHLKIDVDGAEAAVLMGAQEALARETCQALMLEFKLELEQDVVGWLAERHYRLAERYDERNGQKIGNIAYGLWVHEPPAYVVTVTTETSSAATETSVAEVTPPPTTGETKPPRRRVRAPTAPRLTREPSRS